LLDFDIVQLLGTSKGKKTYMGVRIHPDGLWQVFFFMFSCRHNSANTIEHFWMAIKHVVSTERTRMMIFEYIWAKLCKKWDWKPVSPAASNGSCMILPNPALLR
jgi:hypothetical protein